MQGYRHYGWTKTEQKIRGSISETVRKHPFDVHWKQQCTKWRSKWHTLLTHQNLLERWNDRKWLRVDEHWRILGTNNQCIQGGLPTLPNSWNQQTTKSTCTDQPMHHKYANRNHSGQQEAYRSCYYEPIPCSTKSCNNWTQTARTNKREFIHQCMVLW